MPKFDPVIIHHHINHNIAMKVNYSRFLGLEALAMIRRSDGVYEWWPVSLGGRAGDDGENSFHNYRSKYGVKINGRVQN